MGARRMRGVLGLLCIQACASGVAVPTEDNVAGSAAPGPTACGPRQCSTSGLALSAYCSLEHARCPATASEARRIACDNPLAQERTSFRSSCDGESIRWRAAFGAVEYWYDAGGALTSVVTVGEGALAPCVKELRRYGDSSCVSLGEAKPLGCVP